MKKTKLNSIEVAKLARVSQSTVSRVFSSSPFVSEKTRNRVWEVAEELGYRPNALARGLIKNKTRMIGVIIRNKQSLLYSDIHLKISEYLNKKGYYVLLSYTENDEVQQGEIFQFLEYNVDGIVSVDALLSPTVISHLSKFNIPVILFNRYTKVFSPSYHFIGCDNYAAGKYVGEYLLKQNHSRCAYITVPMSAGIREDCEKGFRETLQKRGAEIIIAVEDYTYEGGYRATLRLLNSASPPDAIFCTNDIMALGAIDAAKVLKLSVSKHVSIVGMGDSIMASWQRYSLTTWRQPLDEMIDLTINTLLNTIEGKVKSFVSVLLCGTLMKRNSVRIYSKHKQYNK